MKSMNAVQTKSVMIQNLCVTCFNHCRYCLLSWDGKETGTEWKRGVDLAERYIREIREARPQVNVSFSFGYSMEHPELKEAIQTLRRLGSPTADFLQCDGMAMRDEQQCRELMYTLKETGIRHLNFTVYGPEEYHDRFAGRHGDFGLLLRMMCAAEEAGIPFSTGIPVTQENIKETDELIDTLKKAGSKKITLFIPHEEGRGKTMNPIRLQKKDLSFLSTESLQLLNRDLYRTESDWLKNPETPKTNRSILLSLRADNIENYEKRDALSVLEEIEALDEEYYSSFPDFTELTRLYGDEEGERLYRFRDLYHHYRSLYAIDHKLDIYDVTDERQSGSRRY